MSRMRLTQQEADPIGGIVAAPVVVMGAALAMVVSVVLTISHWHEVVSPVAAAVALALVGAAGIIAAVSAAPARAPFTTERLWLVVTLAVGAAIAEYVSTLGNDRFIYDDFSPVVIGVLILAVAPYCTWLSLLLAGVLASVVLAILVIGSSSTMEPSAPLPSLIALNCAAVLSMSAAAAGYSYGIIDETLAWQREANRAALHRDAELRAGIARSVQQSRVSVLGREVLPFLAGVMTADDISVADADRARELAEALRRALKAGLDATWLGDFAANLQSARETDVVVADPLGAAADLGDDQRAALSALLSWLAEGERAAEITVGISSDGAARRITVDAHAGASPPSRRDLDRFAAVARAVAMRAEVRVTRENVTVEFSHVPG